MRNREMVLIRYLLLFGNQELYEDSRNGFPYSVSVGEYIIEELAEDDLELFHPGLCEIQKEYRIHYKTAGFIPAKFFSGHTNPQISSTVASILSEPYELSKMWTGDSTALKEETGIVGITTQDCRQLQNETPGNYDPGSRQ